MINDATPENVSPQDETGECIEICIDVERLPLSEEFENLGVAMNYDPQKNRIYLLVCPHEQVLSAKTQPNPAPPQRAGFVQKFKLAFPIVARVRLQCQNEFESLLASRNPDALAFVRNVKKILSGRISEYCEKRGCEKEVTRNIHPSDRYVLPYADFAVEGSYAKLTTGEYLAALFTQSICMSLAFTYMLRRQGELSRVLRSRAKQRFPEKSNTTAIRYQREIDSLKAEIDLMDIRVLTSLSPEPLSIARRHLLYAALTMHESAGEEIAIYAGSEFEKKLIACAECADARRIVANFSPELDSEFLAFLSDFCDIEERLARKLFNPLRNLSYLP